MSTAAKEENLSGFEERCRVLPLAAADRLAENSRQGFESEKINSHQGWSEVNFKTATGIGARLRPKGIRSRCQSLNRYAYVLNNPCSLIDPFGLDPCKFNIGVVNNAGTLTDPQIAALEAELSSILGQAGVGANFVSSPNAADYSITVTQYSPPTFSPNWFGFTPLFRRGPCLRSERAK